MKRKRLSRIIGIILTVMMLAGLAVPFASAGGTYTLEFLNPKGRIEPHDNQPLTERVPWQLDAQGHLMEKKVVLRLQYDTTNTGDALALLLMDEFGKYGQYYPDAGIIYVTSAFSGNWGPKTEQNYNVNWVNPTGASGSPSYWQAPTGAPSNWNDLYRSGTGTYSGKIDIVLGGIAN